jgi:hypothetical protein
MSKCVENTFQRVASLCAIGRGAIPGAGRRKRVPGDWIQAFNDHASRHAFSVREFRSFWRCFVERMPELDWCGSIEPVCVNEECETNALRSSRFFSSVR